MRSPSRKRPVTCLLCKEQMYYTGAVEHKPEWSVVLTENEYEKGRYYVHRTCWRKMITSYVFREGKTDKEAYSRVVKLINERLTSLQDDINKMKVKQEVLKSKPEEKSIEATIYDAVERCTSMDASIFYRKEITSGILDSLGINDKRDEPVSCLKVCKL